MGFWDSLLSGIVGTVTGGPIVGGATFLAGLVSDGGSRRSGGAASRNADLDYLTVLQRQAAFQGYLAGRGTAGQQTGGSGNGGGFLSPLVGSSGLPTGLSQFANQRGGQSMGSSLSPGSSAQGNLAQGEAMGNVDLQRLFNSYVGRGLLGMSTLPQSGQQQSYAQGQAAINAQAQQSQRQLLEQLSQRGILRSGITGTGLAQIETGRLQALGGLETQRQEQMAQTQQLAAQLASGTLSQQRAIAAQEPSFGDTLASLAGAYAQYEATRKAPEPTTGLIDYDLLALLSGGGQSQPSASPTTGLLPGAPAGVGPTTADYVRYAIPPTTSPAVASPSVQPGRLVDWGITGVPSPLQPLRAWWQWYD